MTTKLLSILALSLGLFLFPVQSIMASTPATAQSQSEEIPYEVVVDIAQQLDDMDLATEAQALTWYKTGEMSITKVGTLSYKVVMPGGLETILIVDSL